MQEIKCPNCGKVFQVDESGYAEILSQVRNEEFTKELERREKEIEERNKSQQEAARLKQDSENRKALEELEKKLAAKDNEITQLKGEIRNSDNEKQLAVNDAVKKKEDAERKTVEELKQIIAANEKKITELEGKINQSENEKKLAVTEAVSAKEKELNEKDTKIVQLQGQIENDKAQKQLDEKKMIENFNSQLKLKDEQIDQLKDFKARQSTKMIGESLEQHCANEFNKIRMTAFPNAYFEKDNDASSGTKGDFIYRECAPDGTEFISIMFEMKNEADDTAVKHKNEDFFKKLDKDRNEKKCEYAVLVSLLEADSDYYNNGIVDVSYRYEKMYVIRPQFFIPLITLLRNAALNSLTYKQELAIVRNQQIDVMNFEDNMMAFKDAFGKNYDIAHRKFDDAIKEIDTAIDKLNKVKEALLGSDRQLRLANDKVEDLSIKKLTKNAPSVRAMIEEARQNKE